MNRIPSFIIIPNNAPTNDISINLALAAVESAEDDLLACPPSPPALERWSSEGSCDCGATDKCHAPPVAPVRRYSVKHLSCNQEEEQQQEQQDQDQDQDQEGPQEGSRNSLKCATSSTGAPPRLPRRRCSTYGPASLDSAVAAQQAQLAADRWH